MADERREPPQQPSYILRAGKADGGFALQPAARATSQWTLEDAAPAARSAPAVPAGAEIAGSATTVAPHAAKPVAEEHLPYMPRVARPPAIHAAADGAAPPPLTPFAAPHLLAPFRGAGATQRVAALRGELAAAVDAWWRSEQLPSADLLRDGLLALEAGHKLDETQRTLLARTALAHGHGIRTALRHLGDPDRAASLLHEALNSRRLGPEELRALLHGTPDSRHWAPQLATLVRADLGGSPAAADRAETILQVLAADAPPAAGIPHAARKDAAPFHATLTVDDQPARRNAMRPLFAALLLLALAALVVWRVLLRPDSAVVQVSAGQYVVTRSDGTQLRVELAAFDIDRTEVTQRAWADCVAGGGCPALPPAPEPAAGETPVVNVTQAEAEAFCAARGRRLPSAAEWEVAARWAPTTERAWRYPWGDAFQPAFVVGAATHGALAAVGSRSPQGDSPLGAADMAGNAAEWTATPFGAAPDGRIDSTAGEPELAIVIKGGSFLDDSAALQSAASAAQPAGARQPWLGFRCAAHLPD